MASITSTDRYLRDIGRDSRLGLLLGSLVLVTVQREIDGLLDAESHPGRLLASHACHLVALFNLDPAQDSVQQLYNNRERHDRQKINSDQNLLKAMQMLPAEHDNKIDITVDHNHNHNAAGGNDENAPGWYPSAAHKSGRHSVQSKFIQRSREEIHNLNNNCIRPMTMSDVI
ncbi:hypothetical protein PRZ48_000003 [Zasmidium cellare]|uniref:Uncharacterized protein n=1 Tax=Zasmidium cellare TaxID=395010 RepID=A0ABR0EZN1_ZASCE|nr:hypothetical protein PRZ48_000003 [Zasmidium cellare]